MPGRLGIRSSLAITSPAFMSRVSTSERLAAGRLLTSEDRLLRGAQNPVDEAEVLNGALEVLDVAGVVVVVAGERLVQREVLLDNLGTEKVCRRKRLHRGVGGDVVRIADLEVRERALKRLDDAEVGIVGAGGIAEHAVQDGNVAAT